MRFKKYKAMIEEYNNIEYDDFDSRLEILERMKEYLDDFKKVNVIKIKNKLKNGELDYQEYCDLKDFLKEKKKYEKNEYFINSEYNSCLNDKKRNEKLKEIEKIRKIKEQREEEERLKKVAELKKEKERKINSIELHKCYYGAVNIQTYNEISDFKKDVGDLFIDYFRNSEYNNYHLLILEKTEEKNPDYNYFNPNYKFQSPYFIKIIKTCPIILEEVDGKLIDLISGIDISNVTFNSNPIFAKRLEINKEQLNKELAKLNSDDFKKYTKNITEYINKFKNLCEKKNIQEGKIDNDLKEKIYYIKNR